MRGYFREKRGDIVWDKSDKDFVINKSSVFKTVSKGRGGFDAVFVPCKQE